MDEIRYTPTELLTNSGFIQSTVPEELREDILTEIKEVSITKKLPMNDQLVGLINEEYALPKLVANPKFLDYTRRLCHIYDQHFKDVANQIEFLGRRDSVIVPREEYWVNLQRKYEYNPVHNHTGLYSFVIWVKIPYDLQKEKEYFKTRKKKGICNFSFVYNTDSVVSYVIDVDKSFEWEIILFPSHRNHTVTPFMTSDDVRISIAGNLTVDF